jgi:type I restriction enzyme S subunit
MKSNWPTKKLGEVLQYEQPTKYIVKSTKYSDAYGTPVLTAGKSFILGKTAEKNGIFPNSKLPVIIFDDFTTASKFVNFPFKVKSSAMKILHPIKGISDARFLFYVMQNIEFDHTGIHKRYWISEYSNIEIFFPPLPEQHRIVKILDDAFDQIAKAKANTEKNLQNSRELLESYLQGVFEKPQKDWQKKRLGDLCEKITKGSSPKWQGISYVRKPGILFITSENVGENKLILDNKKYVEEKFNIKDKKSILKFGDVLTNIVGASIGRTAIFTLQENANINQAVCILRCDVKVLNNQYLTNLLNSPFLKKILHDNEVNTARANLSLSFFSNLEIPLPPLVEQKAIVKKLDALAGETKKLEAIYQQKLDDLEELEKSLLKKAFNGEL